MATKKTDPNDVGGETEYVQPIQRPDLTENAYYHNPENSNAVNPDLIPKDIGAASRGGSSTSPAGVESGKVPGGESYPKKLSKITKNG